MKKPKISFLISTLLGAAIWFLSPYITGEIEPWDSPYFYYIYALVIAGFIAAIPKDASYSSVYFGVLVGQILYLLTLSTSALIIVGLIIITICSLLSIIGLFMKRNAYKARTNN
ncbi:hypothetical protein [Glaciecola sp. 1036]|uniref:hypothetical protein n=1 Tax=Alteromonadaceae TaxID=72275 RepID=UPI003D07FB55